MRCGVPLNSARVPLAPAIGGYLDGTNGAPAGPGQPADLVESAAGQLLSAGRVGDDRLWSDLVAERRLFRLPIEMPELVVVHVVPVDDLDAPQILGVENSLEARAESGAPETLAAAARPRRSGHRR